MLKLQLLIFTVVLLKSGVIGDDGSDQQSTDVAPSTENSENDVTGQWYIVMSSGCSDGVENMLPCACLTAYFRPLLPNNWQVFITATNSKTKTLVVSMGGAGEESSGATELDCFILSAAEVPESVLVTESNYTISDQVHGSSTFSPFHMSIIGYSAEDFYMITKLTKNGSESTLVWCRKKTPGKETIWTKIVEKLYSLNLNPHDLSFIPQQECMYPTLNQFDEMFFCQ